MMSEEIPFLSVPSKYGELIRKRLLALALFDTNYKIVSEEKVLFFPLREHIDIEQTFPELPTSEYSVGRRNFPEAFDGPKTLSDALKGRLTEKEVELLPRAYDLIGDIAILEIPEELVEHRFEIGHEFLKLRPNFTTVLGKNSAISGTLRIREYELLAGADKRDTIHVEYGCRIAVDLSKAYFSPRLLEEHNRIARQVVEDEHVVDMFSGVGPFALHIAKRTRATITAVDINPDASNLLKQSIPLNRLEGTIVPITADIRDYTESSKSGFADRVIMNHPSGAFNFIGEACKLLREDGVMHYYDFMGGEDPEQALCEKVKRLIEKSGRAIKKILLIRRVRDSAPYEYHMVLDAIIS
ncbi:MAG: class I SAM-dependent methyltransferase family protein [Candidatus Thorarchaeota archaeon]